MSRTLRSRELLFSLLATVCVSTVEGHPKSSTFRQIETPYDFLSVITRNLSFVWFCFRDIALWSPNQILHPGISPPPDQGEPVELSPQIYHAKSWSIMPLFSENEMIVWDVLLQYTRVTVDAIDEQTTLYDNIRTLLPLQHYTYPWRTRERESRKRVWGYAPSGD